MDLTQSAKSREIAGRLSDFMAEHIYPNERRFYQEAERLGPWSVTPVVEELKPLARAAGLWDLLLRAEAGGLTNLEYAPCARSWAARISRRGVQLQRARHRQHGDDPALRDGGAEDWLKPLLAGEIRSAFAMTEPDVASSDATNVGELDRARRRPLRDQRPQVVHDRRDRPALQDRHLHGADRPGESGSAPPAVDGARSQGHARRPGRPLAARARLLRHAGLRCWSFCFCLSFS